MKIIVIVLVIVGIITFIVKAFKKDESSGDDFTNIPETLFSINDGNQNELIYYVDYDQEWLDALDKKYSWDNFDKYDNRFFEYMYRFIDELPSQAHDIDDNQEYFNNLTRGQKVFYTLLVFGGQVDNGGVYQFFFNTPEFSYAVLETLEELGLTKLRDDYEKCLEEILGSVDKLNDRRTLFSDESKDWEKRWKAFSSGYSDVPSALVIEDYFYSEEHQKLRYQTMVKYIDEHMDQFVKK